MLAACTSGDADPTPSTGSIGSVTTPNSPTPTQTGPLTTGPNVRPGEKPPEYPALARRHDGQGALAFAYYFYEAYDWGYATNDPYLVEQISDPHCAGCRKYVKSLR